MNLDIAHDSWTEIPLPIEPTPSAAELARARSVVISAEADAFNMGVQTARQDPRPEDVRAEDRARTRELEADTSGDLGALAREIHAAHSAAIDATDNLDRLAFLVAFLVRRSGVDITAAIREYDEAACLVARHGEGADYAPPSRSCR